MIKVGKILEIMGIFLIFFDFGWGFWIFGSTPRCSECSDDKKVWGGGFGIFFLWGLGFFCKFAEMLWFFFEKEIFEIFLII